MIGGVLLPSLALGALGWVVPRLLARLFPEGVAALVALALVAAAVMTGIAAALFVALYVLAGAPAGRLPALLDAGALVHFGGLAAASALIWAPLLVLSVAGLPARWQEATW